MKINMPKRTPAQLRKREAALVEELCAHHSYMFSTDLPERQQSTVLAMRTKTAKGIKLSLRPAVVAKIIVPLTSKLGIQIVAWRKAKAKKGKRS